MTPRARRIGLGIGLGILLAVGWVQRARVHDWIYGQGDPHREVTTFVAALKLGMTPTEVEETLDRGPHDWVALTSGANPATWYLDTPPTLDDSNWVVTLEFEPQQGLRCVTVGTRANTARLADGAAQGPCRDGRRPTVPRPPPAD
jgi:hypothetical protein